MFLLDKLRVYQKAQEFADEIIRSVAVRKMGLSRPLADQLIRASTSIATNLSEGNGRWTKRDRRNFFYIARGSLFECLPLLHFLVTAEVITKDEEQKLRIKGEEICKMINGLIQGMDDKRNSR